MDRSDFYVLIELLRESIASPAAISEPKHHSQSETTFTCFNGALECFEIEEAPPYYAISYVWGDESKPKSILIGDLSMNITENLHQVLVQIYGNAAHLLAEIAKTRGEEQASQLYIWADAICLDQHNELEMKTQIPRMGHIFSKAFNVFVWLGELPECSTSLVDDCLSAFDWETDTCFEERWPRIFIPVFELAIALARSTWFDRLWIIQEYALSDREPWVQTSHGKLPLERIRKLFSLCLELKEVDLVRFPNGGSGVTPYKALLPLITSFMSTTSKDFRRATFQHLSLFDRLEYVLLRKGKRQYRRRHDVIYAVLGLVDATDLSAELQPDYAKDFMAVAEIYTRNIFQKTGSLCLLGNLEAHIDESVPSWVSTFELVYLTSSPDFERKHRQTNIVFQNGMKEMVVDGRMLANIAKHTPVVSVGDRNAVKRAVLYVWEEIIPVLARSHNTTVDSLWRESMTALLRIIGGSASFQNVAELLKAADDLTHIEHQVAEAAMDCYTLYGWAMLEDASLIFYWPAYRVFREGEHFVVLFPGAASYTILEQLPDGKYRCVAQAQGSADFSLRPKPFTIYQPDLFHPSKLQRFVLR